MKTLKQLWHRWQKIARVIGDFQGQVILTIFYFLIFWMVGLVVRFVSDPLNIKSKIQKSNFVPWNHPAQTLVEAQKQY